VAPQLDSDSIREMFARHGIRCTRQREEIFSVLHRSCAHPTAEELFHDVRASQPGLSLATVYNTLEIFTRRGLCRKLAVGQASLSLGGASRYDADLTEHLHLITCDGQVQDIPSDLGDEIMRHIPSQVVERIERAMGVRISRMNVDFLAALGDGKAENGAGESE
jgi:Fur family peroxide stress response transcriptional regulator